MPGHKGILKEWGWEAFTRVHYINFEQSPGAKKIFDQDFDISRIIEDLEFFLKSYSHPSRFAANHPATTGSARRFLPAGFCHWKNNKPRSRQIQA